MNCTHPQDQRWQYPQFWLCCACYRYFWGDKKNTPEEDIYGQKDVPLNKISGNQVTRN